ncbi:MAG: hypothetical protein ACE5OO_07970, partial [Candidatus Bathyarchaeia archaeon]
MSQEPGEDVDREDDVEMTPPPQGEMPGAGQEEEPGGGDVALDPDDVEEAEPAAQGPPAVAPQPVDAGLGPPPSSTMSLEEIVDTLRRVREDVGQISELSSEEGKMVEAFSLALLNLMQPLAKAIPVDPSALPGEMGDVERANIVPRGELMVLYGDGEMEAIDLREKANRDLLVEVIRDV